MSYSVNLLISVAECNLVLAAAAKEKSDLDYQQDGIERQIENYATTGSEIDVLLAAINAEIVALQNIIVALPAGTLKDENVGKLKKAEYNQYLLTKRDKNYGSMALLDKQLELEKKVQHAIVLDGYIAAVAGRKAELS